MLLFQNKSIVTYLFMASLIAVLPFYNLSLFHNGEQRWPLNMVRNIIRLF